MLISNDLIYTQVRKRNTLKKNIKQAIKSILFVMTVTEETQKFSRCIIYF